MLLSRIAVTVFAIAMLTPSPANGGPAEQATAATDSRRIDATEVVAHGQLKAPGGQVVQNGRVTVYAFPADTSNLAEGDKFDLVEIGSATTDTQGNYSVTPDYSVLRGQGFRPDPGQADQPDSIPLNVNIVASGGAGNWIDATTVWVDDNFERGHVKGEDLAQGRAVGLQRKAAGVIDDDADGPTFDMTLEDDPGIAKAVSAFGQQTAERGYVASIGAAKTDNALLIERAGGVPSNCTVLSTHLEPVTVGQTAASTGYGYTQRLTFTSSANSTLGIGLSSSGSYGSYSASGSTTVGTSSSTGFPTRTTSGSSYMRTSYKYGKMKCRYYYDSYGHYFTRYQYRAISHAGGASTASATRPSTSYCRPYSGGTSFTKKTSVASTFSTGAKTSGVIGINLSSRSGYTSATSMKHTFKYNKRLCGARDYPAGSPGLLKVLPR